MSLAYVVTLAICSFVILGVLLGLYGGLSRARRIVAGLRSGGDLARSLASHPAPEAAFAHRWSELDAAFRASPEIAPAWASYAASVSTSTLPDGSGALASTVPPEDCLRSDRLAGGPWTDARMARLSGLLVTLGIFGTFIGLTLGLVEANFAGIQAIASAEAKTEALQSAMFGLLAGSSTAFVTSVAGLAGSLILTVAVRQLASRGVESELAATSAALRAGIRVELPDQRLIQHLDRLTRQLSASSDLRPLLERIARASERPAAASPEPRPAASERLDGSPLDARLQGLETAIEQLATALQDVSSPTPAVPPWVEPLTAAISALSESPSPAASVAAAAAAPPWLDRLEQRLAAPLPPPAWATELSTALSELTAARPPDPGPPTWATELTRATQELAARTPAANAGAEESFQARTLELLTAQNTLLQGLAHAAPPGEPPSSATAELLEVLRQLHSRLDTPLPDTAPAVAVAQASGAAFVEAISPGVDDARAVAERFASASGDFNEATTRLDAAARSNHDAAETLRQAAQQLTARMQVLQQATAAMRTGLAHHTDASNALTTAAATLQGVGPQIVRASDQIRLSTSSVEVTAERLAALQRASGGAEMEQLVPVLQQLLAVLEARR